MLPYLAAIPLSLLPERWRESRMRASDPVLRTGALVSGGVQCFLFFYIANLPMHFAIQAVMLYFCVEGLARFAAAFASIEILPTAPLWLAAMLQEEREHQQQERSLPPPRNLEPIHDPARRRPALRNRARGIRP